MIALFFSLVVERRERKKEKAEAGGGRGRQGRRMKLA